MVRSRTTAAASAGGKPKRVRSLRAGGSSADGQHQGQDDRQDDAPQRREDLADGVGADQDDDPAQRPGREPADPDAEHLLAGRGCRGLPESAHRACWTWRPSCPSRWRPRDNLGAPRCVSPGARPTDASPRDAPEGGAVPDDLGDLSLLLAPSGARAGPRPGGAPPRRGTRRAAPPPPRRRYGDPGRARRRRRRRAGARAGDARAHAPGPGGSPRPSSVPSSPAPTATRRRTRHDLDRREASPTVRT